MEDTKTGGNGSCLMLMANIVTPVSLQVIFDTGVELESHITVLFSSDKQLDLDITKDLLMQSPLWEILNIQKNLEDYTFPVLDYFDLDIFENDSDFVILKLKDKVWDREPEVNWYKELGKLNTTFRNHFTVKSDFGNYIPHLTLATVEKGTGHDYLKNESLRLILEQSIIHFEDFTLSYDRGDKKYELTGYNSVNRFFRLRDLEREDIF